MKAVLLGLVLVGTVAAAGLAYVAWALRRTEQVLLDRPVTEGRILSIEVAPVARAPPSLPTRSVLYCGERWTTCTPISSVAMVDVASISRTAIWRLPLPAAAVGT